MPPLSAPTSLPRLLPWLPLTLLLPASCRHPATANMKSAPQAMPDTVCPASALTGRPTARFAVPPWPSAPDLPVGQWGEQGFQLGIEGTLAAQQQDSKRR